MESKFDSNGKETAKTYDESPKKSFNLNSDRPKPTFNLRRPETLNLSIDYSSSSQLKSLKNGKKTMSYDLWVNENITKANEPSSAKKSDLAGRVSFR